MLPALPHAVDPLDVVDDEWVAFLFPFLGYESCAMPKTKTKYAALHVLCKAGTHKATVRMSIGNPVAKTACCRHARDISAVRAPVHMLKAVRDLARQDSCKKN